MFHRFPNIRFTIRLGTIFRSTHSKSGNTIAYSTVFGSSRTRFIIIVHDVHMHSLSTVAAISRPIIKNIVPHIHMLTFLSERTGTKSGKTAFMVCQQIMMKRRFRSSPDGSISVFSFGMTGRPKAFGNKTPLNSQVFTTVHRTTLVYRPTDRTMVYNNILAVGTSKSVGFSTAFIADTKPYITNNNIVGVNSYRTSGNTDALPRCRLSGNSQISVSDS